MCVKFPVDYSCCSDWIDWDTHKGYTAQEGSIMLPFSVAYNFRIEHVDDNFDTYLLQYIKETLT